MPNRCHPLLHQINEISFAMDELRLFLDTHPNCVEAIAQYNELNARRTVAVREYEAKFGPLSYYSDSGCNTFTWVNAPWPWQN